MTEEKKAQIRKSIALIEIGLAAVLVVYLIYGIVTKNSNPLFYNGLAIVVVTAGITWGQTGKWLQAGFTIKHGISYNRMD